MCCKKKFILLLIILLALLSISSCSRFGSGSAAIEPTPIDTFSLSRTPKLGETAELTFSNNLRFYTPFTENTTKGEVQNIPKVRAWVEFSYANTRGSYSEAKHAAMIPYDEVLVSGQLSWEGNLLEIDDTLELGGTIKLPREGFWFIKGYTEAEGLDSPLMENTFEEEIRVAVTKDAARIINVIQDYTGPFTHLGNFPYGRISERMPDEVFYPTILELDISKIPEVGEETVVTCIIRSLLDAPDYSAEIRFAKRQEDNSILKVPGESLLVDGDLKWEGYLKKNEPVEFSATIMLAEEGDWRIQVLGDLPKYPGNFITDTIKITITDEMSYYGWEERPLEPSAEDIELSAMNPLTGEIHKNSTEEVPASPQHTTKNRNQIK